MITQLPGLTPLIEEAKKHLDTPQRLKHFKAYDTGEFFFNPRRKGEAYQWVVDILDPTFAGASHPLWVKTFADSMLPPHVDEKARLCAINIPVIGDWDKTKILAYPDNDVDGECIEYKFGPPVLLDTSRLHAVDNRNCSERIVLSLGFYNAGYEDVLFHLEQGALFKRFPYNVTDHRS